jgi:mannosylglycoprotein endo-beta-mannosidase
VKWKVVCKDKKKGGLGVRDLEVVNLSLLSKWRWRLLNREDLALWKEVLVAKYGLHILNNVNLSMEVSPYFESLWWKDICSLEGWVDSTNWLEDVIVRRLGNGMHTQFWKDVWIGDSPLCIRFPRLYSISLQKNEYVEVLLEVDGERRRWNFLWRRNLFQWEVDKVGHLEAFLVNVRLSQEIDEWKWIINSEEGFTVKSAYDLLVDYGESPILSSYEMKIFTKIWESPAPSKMVVFSLQLFHNRLPTKDNLYRRGVLELEVGVNCVWCVSNPESAKHLFDHCNFVSLFIGCGMRSLNG